MIPCSERIDLEINSLLRLHRVAKGLSCGQLAKQSDFSERQIAAYESGQQELTVSDLIKLTTALDISLTDVMTKLQARLSLSEAFDPVGTTQAMCLMASNRGRQAIHAIASCKNPKLVEALFDMIIASCLSEVVPNVPKLRESVEKGT